MTKELIKDRIKEYKHTSAAIYKIANEDELWSFTVMDLETSLTKLEKLLLRSVK